MAPESHQLTASRSAVLIVDDEGALARGLARVLRKAGFTVALAADGEQALELFAGSVFDVVLSDITMPGIDGLELIRRMREIGVGIPVVLMTGNLGPVTAKTAVDLGAFALLSKPLDHEELVATLEQAFKSGDASR